MTWWTSGQTQVKQKFRFFVEISDNLFLFNVKTVTKPSAQVETKEFQLINHKFNYPGIVTWQPIKITMVDMRGLSLVGLAKNIVDSALFQAAKGEDTGFLMSELAKQEQALGTEAFDTAAMLYAMLQFSGYAIPTTGKHSISIDGKTKRDITSPEKASTIANAFGKGMIEKADFKRASRGTSSNNQSIRIYLIDGNGFVVEKWVLHNPIIKTINWGDLDYAADDPVEYTLDIAYDFATMHLGDGEKLSPTIENFNAFLKKYASVINK